jgi:hypothetical protein
MPQLRDELEQAFSRLAGHSVARVVYLGAWSAAPSEPGAYVEWIEVLMERSAHFRITTEPDFGDHGLQILEGPVDRSGALKVFDATTVAPWDRAIGAHVTGVKVFWRPLQYVGAAAPGEPPEYPRDVELTFDNGEVVVLSAAGTAPDGELVLGVDSVIALRRDDAAAAFAKEQART